MRNPEMVLRSLESNTKKPAYRFEKLYRNFYNPEFFYMAYQNIYANPGNMTVGTDNETIDGMSDKKIKSIIELLKTESYNPTPVRRVYIDKKNGGKRPLGIPSFTDKLIQEVTRLILEAIYEPKFSKNSHGFRKGKSCHTALSQIKNTFNKSKWFVEGDIKGFFDNINHHTLINILKKSINDEKFIRLIWKFLRAGYIDNWNFQKTYSGTPQGGIISPILSNIYLDVFDNFMEQYKNDFDKGKMRTHNKEWKRLDFQIRKRKRKIDNEDLSDEQIQSYKLEINALTKERQQHRSTDPMDANYRRIHYVRYADDFLISVIGSKEDALQVKGDLTDFLKQHLQLELSQEKTLITYNGDFARFLGYDITTWQTPYIRKKVDGRVSMTSGHIMLYLPKDVWVNKLKTLGAVKLESLNSDNWLSKARPELMNLDDLEIVTIYNAEILGLYNYYQLASNVSVLSNFWRLMEQSMLKTYAAKYKSSRAKIHSKYSINGKFGIPYETKEGSKRRYFVDRSFTKKSVAPKEKYDADLLPNIHPYKNTTSLMSRLKAEKCEWCGATDVPLEMHHVRKLKDVQSKNPIEQLMIARNRKTIALCAQGEGNSCHSKLHAGKL